MTQISANDDIFVDHLADRQNRNITIEASSVRGWIQRQWTRRRLEYVSIGNFPIWQDSDNLVFDNTGWFLPGIRPGDQTARYIDGVMTRLTLWGAAYVTAVALLPEFMIIQWNVPFYFGGTSLLIIVVVTMDFMAQVQARMMTHQYEGLLKKANLKGYGRSGTPR